MFILKAVSCGKEAGSRGQTDVVVQGPGEGVGELEGGQEPAQPAFQIRP